MKTLTFLLSALLCFFTTHALAQKQGTQGGGDSFPQKPGHTNWYAVDLDGDGSPDILTKSQTEVWNMSREGSMVYTISTKSSKEIQVRVVEKGGDVTLSVEDVGTPPYGPNEKILRLNVP